MFDWVQKSSKKLFEVLTLLKPIQDVEQKAPSLSSTSSSPVTSTNVGVRPKNFLTFSFNLFATLV